MISQKERIVASLAPLFRKAEQERKWFYIPYWGLYFSPDELREQLQKGKFVFFAQSWELRAPEKELECLLDRISDLEREVNDFHHRYTKWMKGE